MEALRLAAAIIDWRDADELPRPDGAESLYYRRAHLPLPRNGPIETLGELTRVRGMTDDLYACVRPMLTVYSGSAGVDFAAAGSDVRSVFAWAHDHKWRGKDWPDGTPATSEINPAASAGNLVFELRAAASRSGGAKYGLVADVRLTGNLAAPFQVVRWGKEFEGRKACHRPAD